MPYHRSEHAGYERPRATGVSAQCGPQNADHHRDCLCDRRAPVPRAEGWRDIISDQASGRADAPRLPRAGDREPDALKTTPVTLGVRERQACYSVVGVDVLIT